MVTASELFLFVFYRRECGRQDSPCGEFWTFPSLRIGKFKIGTGGVLAIFAETVKTSALIKIDLRCRFWLPLAGQLGTLSPNPSLGLLALRTSAASRGCTRYLILKRSIVSSTDKRELVEAKRIRRGGSVRGREP